MENGPCESANAECSGNAIVDLLFQSFVKFLLRFFEFADLISSARLSQAIRFDTAILAATSKPFHRLEPSLLLGFGWWGCRIGRKESVRGVIVANVPKVLRHGNDEAAHNQDGNQCCVLACPSPPQRKRHNVRGRK